MATKFAALESRLTTAVFVHLSNAEAMLGGVLVAGIFDNGYTLGSVGSVGMATTQPTWTIPTASVPENVVDYFQNYPASFDPMGLIVKFTESGPAYRITAHEPDGTGVSLLLLELT